MKIFFQILLLVFVLFSCNTKEKKQVETKTNPEIKKADTPVNNNDWEERWQADR